MAEGSGNGFGSPSRTSAAPLLFGQPISEPLTLGPPAVSQTSFFGIRAAPATNSTTPPLSAPGSSGFGQASLSGLSPFQLVPFGQSSAQAAATSSGFPQQWTVPSVRLDAASFSPFDRIATPTLFGVPSVPPPLFPAPTFPTPASLFGTSQSSLPIIGSGTVFGKPSDGGTSTPDVTWGKGQSSLPEPTKKAPESGEGGIGPPWVHGAMSNRQVEGQESLSSPSSGLLGDGIKDLK